MSFTPVGEKSRATLVYDLLLQDLTPGRVITYAEFSAALDGYNVLHERGPIYDAIRRLESNNERTLEVIPKVGYRIVEANEHTRLAVKKQKRARRQLGKARKVLLATDQSKLTPDERATVNAMIARVSHVEQMVRSQKTRIDSIETKTNDEIEKIKAALKERGIDV